MNHGRHGEVIAGAPHPEHYPTDSNGYDRTSGTEELHRPASYMVKYLFLHHYSLCLFFFLNYNCSHLLMGLPLFALVQPMHIHYTGWRQENNYVPMNFDGRVQHHPMHHHQQQQQHQQQHIGNSHFGGTDHSLSFDSQHTGPSSLRDPFTPVMNGNSHLNQYEIQVDSAAAAVDRPR